MESICSRTSRKHTYPRPDLVNLYTYLKTVSDNCVPVSSSSAEQDLVQNTFILFRDINFQRNFSFAATSEGLESFKQSIQDQSSALVFIRGYASPAWLQAIGARFELGPDLFHRHLNYKAFTAGVRDYYSDPSLPSSSNRVFQLMLPTIFTSNFNLSNGEPKNLLDERKQFSHALLKYFQNLKTSAMVADSVVRDVLVLNKKEYVLQQTISVEVAKLENGWRAIIWMDHGRDLADSAKGPWYPPLNQSFQPHESYFYPIIVQHTNNDFLGAVSQSISHSADGHNGHPWKASQNTCLLPFEYGSHLNKEEATEDAFYALSELFHFVASAGVQYLNLFATRIEDELSFIGIDDHAESQQIILINLRYMKTHLVRYRDQLTGTSAVLRNRNAFNWPQPEEISSTVTASTALLSSDFDYLLERSQNLVRECESGMDTLASNAAVAEAQRSYKTGLQAKKLTIVATLFIPLSFVCSVWGMNTAQLGSGSVSVVWVLLSLVPTFLITAAIYFWNDLERYYNSRKAIP